MKNDISALNNILFEQLERLMDDDELADEKAFDREMKRAKEVSQVAGAIVNNHKNALSAMKLAAEYGGTNEGLKMLGIEYKNE